MGTEQEVKEAEANGGLMPMARELFTAHLDATLAPKDSVAEREALARRTVIASRLTEAQRSVVIVLGLAFASGLLHLADKRLF